MPFFGSKKKKEKEKSDGKKKTTEKTTENTTLEDRNYTHITRTTTTTETFVTTELKGGSVRLPTTKKRPPLPNIGNTISRFSDGREYRVSNRPPLTPHIYLPTTSNSDGQQFSKPNRQTVTDAAVFQPFDPKAYGIKPYIPLYGARPSISNMMPPQSQFKVPNLPDMRQRSQSVSHSSTPSNNLMGLSNMSIPEAIKDDELKIKVKKSFKIMKPMNNKLEIYDTSSKNRAFVFMINNVKYQVPTNYRDGAKIDEKNLMELFGQMGFKLDVHHDKKAADMKKLVTQHCKNSALRKFDISIVIVMGHGYGTSEGNTTVLGVDDKQVSLSWILEQFNSKNCLFLESKPKIFIFQCCRGDNEQDILQHDAIKSIEPREYGDMLIAYSTIPGFVSYRIPKTGSLFIESLCKIFMEHACDTDVETMLKLIDKELKNRNNIKQTTNFENRGFHKVCYINPGI